jgi:UV excision repair protein RAD23
MVHGPGGTIGVTITPEEKAILDRLEALGYSRQKALEAFLICDRSEEAAANYLMDHGGEDFADFQD